MTRQKRKGLFSITLITAAFLSSLSFAQVDNNGSVRQEPIIPLSKRSKLIHKKQI